MAEGHQVLVEGGAGAGSEFSDEEYAAAGLGAIKALRQDESLMRGLNSFGGALTNEAVGEALGLPARPPDTSLRALGDL